MTGFTEGPGGVVSGGSVCDPHTDANCAGLGATVFDNNARTAVIKTEGGDWRAKYQGDGWSLSGQTGFSTSRAMG